jgi:hypothetical protein
VLVLDTAPSSRTDVKRPDLLFALARMYRGGPLASAVCAGVTSFLPAPPAEPGTDPQIVHKGHMAGAWAGTPAMASEAVYIADFVRPAADQVRAERVVYLQATHPGKDPLIRVRQAIAGWRQTFAALTVATIPTRRGDWHVPLIERPQETLNAMLAA